MDVLSGPVVVVLPEGDAAALARQLVQVIQLGYVRRGAQPPRLLLDFASAVSRAARGSATPEPQRAASPQVTAGRGTAELPASADPSWSGQPVGLLTASEAARTAGVSASYLRRVIRRGDVQASQDRWGVWHVDPDGLAAWCGQRRRKERAKAA